MDIDRLIAFYTEHVYYFVASAYEAERWDEFLAEVLSEREYQIGGYY